MYMTFLFAAPPDVSVLDQMINLLWDAMFLLIHVLKQFPTGIELFEA